MSSISVSSLVLGSLSVEVEGSNSTLALSVLATAPAVLSVELGTPGAQGPAATIAVGTTTTLSPGAAATVVNAGTSSAAVFNFGIPAGLKGDTGNTGATGTAATISVGSTTTGAAGSSASVTNSGTSSAAVFNFTIPRGDKGDTGNTGATGATGAVGPGVATGGTTGQFLSKASGTNYDTTWATIVPGDRYLTSSTTSLTINNSNKTLTVGTGLSYTPTQNITISYDASHHMHGEVLTYNSGTGEMTVDVNHHTGSGTYSAWVVNVGGVTPVTSTAWGAITGTLSDQTDLQTALDAKLAKASNLSDLANAGTARTNLGLGTAAVEPATKLVPAGGTTGQVLTKLSNADWDDAWATPSGGGGANVQSFGTSTTSGTFTWTKPANAKQVHVHLWSGGGGGGSGSCNSTSIGRSGGGGGAGGTYMFVILDPAELGATESVVVGAGGNGGAGVTTTTGNNGTAGGQTTFKNYRAVSGNFGNGGSSGSAAAGAARQSLALITLSFNGGGGNGATGGGTTAVTTTSVFYAPTGGGGGAGGLAGGTGIQSGGAGGSMAFALNNSGLNVSIAGGNGGNPSGPVAATAGTTSTNSYIGGTGGGGGYYRTAFAGSAGAAGGWPGGGGGGGGGTDTGFTSGAGGAGGNGRAIIITYT